MAKYGKKAGEKVERAMHERKRGKLKSGRSGKTREEPQAGDRHRSLGGAEGWREGPQEEGIPQVVQETLTSTNGRLPTSVLTRR